MKITKDDLIDNVELLDLDDMYMLHHQLEHMIDERESTESEYFFAKEKKTHN